MADQFTKADRSKYTKNMVTRIRLGRQFSSPMEGAGEEYGNYEKYENDKNRVDQVNDPGYEDAGFDTLKLNVQKMMESMRHPERDEIDDVKQKGEEAVIENSLKSTAVDGPELMETYTSLKDQQLNRMEIEDWKSEKEAFKSPEMGGLRIYGRMSPQAKEELYKSYLMGTKVKDLSMKYGILPQRVKAIVYQKHMYWEEVYPRLGETHQRLAMQMELIYARHFPFVDYGIDLDLMAEMDKGVRITRLSN